MVLQTFDDNELFNEIIAEINDDIVDKLLYWAGRQVKRSDISKGMKKYDGKRFILSYEPVKITSAKRGNQFVAVNVIEVDEENGQGYCPIQQVTFLYLRFPEKYLYRSDKGKKDTGVLRDGYQYVLFSRNPKGETVFFRLTAHFLDRVYQRSEIFRKEHSKRIGGNQNIIQTLSEALVHNCLVFDFDEVDLLAEDPTEFIQFLKDEADEERLKEYLKDGSLPIRFLDGYAILRPVNAERKVGVLKTFIHHSSMREDQAKIGDCFGSSSGNEIHAIDHVRKY